MQRRERTRETPSSKVDLCVRPLQFLLGDWSEQETLPLTPVLPPTFLCRFCVDCSCLFHDRHFPSLYLDRTAAVGVCLRGEMSGGYNSPGAAGGVASSRMQAVSSSSIDREEGALGSSPIIGVDYKK